MLVVCGLCRQSDLKRKIPIDLTAVWALTDHEAKKRGLFVSCDLATNDADINNHAPLEMPFPHRLNRKVAAGDRMAGDVACLSEGQKASSAHNVYWL